MFGFDIVVTETTAVELEVDPAVADTYYSDSEEEYGPETTRTFHEDKDTSKPSVSSPAHSTMQDINLTLVEYKLPIDKKLTLARSSAPVAESYDGWKNILTTFKPRRGEACPRVMLGLDMGYGQLNLVSNDKLDCRNATLTGTATEYPNTQVIGTDLSPSTRESTPENCKFVVADAEEAWDFPHKFDFVHMRDLMMCFSDQKEVFRSAYNALEPGGYFQILDGKLPLASIDDSMESSGIARWFQACVDAGEAGSRPWTNIPKYMEWLEDIGFEEVTETVYHNPINDWAIGAKEKQVGVMMQKDIKRWLYSTTRTVLEGSNMNEEEVKELLLKAKESGRDRNIHAYIPIYVVWGRKPFPSES
ncbi:hypothetical protein BTUL_0093g00370 [Botrytis tulipae]|uniref:Methyltransferase type 11 domain-containing protein n=1 Tax=Botrytis tulipae TaxID=87230 RepID=A0A4Z1EN40_9HELO|nr:hypothetical protein BTUL_0093g00370 [Botrytis tulipae]